MKTLVAGGAGFIGSHLCDLLLNKGHKVYCVDNLITGSENNIVQQKKSKNFKFIKEDIVELSHLAVPDVDCIFHLASPASPVDYQENPEETALTNSMGTYNLLKIAVKYNAKFLLASTSEIYGDPLEHPQKETYFGNVNSFGPRSCYDESKRFAETLVYIFIKKYRLDARIIRIFNTYGPRMQKDDGRVVSNFINQAIDGDPLTVYGEGAQTRSFCFVSDLTTGIYKAMFTKTSSGKIFNLGNPEEYTVIELAGKIMALTNSKSEIIHKPLPKDDPSKRRPDITKARSVLDWLPQVTLNEGLKETISYYRSLK